MFSTDQKKLLCWLALTTSSVLLVGAPAHAQPNPVGFALYFDSEVRDAAECAMRVENGEVVIDKQVINPSMSCPDMFSWKLFVEVVRQEWWTDWASDEQTWPQKPFKLCADGKPGPDCCLPGNKSNPGYEQAENPAVNCPYFPGDHQELLESLVPPRRLRQPIGAHAIFLGQGGLANGLMTLLGKPGEPEPGRVIRQEVGEITVRNKPMFDYIFRNDLYNSQGIARVFARNQGNLASKAPYQASNPAGNLSKIDLPIPAVMIKSNWLFHEFAKELGLRDDPAAPYIKKNMTTTLGTKVYTGEHWLVAFHISTKDIPQWVWTTFEHVNNPGRCDFTGCNDAYGYAAPDARPAETVNNFTAPYVRNDGLQTASVIFDLGKTYSSGPISRGLAAIFNATGMGSTPQAGMEPRPTDKGWLSYRLKGSQVNFTNAMGRATRLGNSITEGGFMATSSCITCHARAAVAATGNNNQPLTVPLGVFHYDELSEVGYRQSARGIPDKDWFHGSGARPSLQALQTDFLWGMPFFAQALATPAAVTAERSQRDACAVTCCAKTKDEDSCLTSPPCKEGEIAHCDCDGCNAVCECLSTR